MKRSALGDDAEANLITLCRSWHQILHRSGIRFRKPPVASCAFAARYLRPKRITSPVENWRLSCLRPRNRVIK